MLFIALKYINYIRSYKVAYLPKLEHDLAQKPRGYATRYLMLRFVFT